MARSNRGSLPARESRSARWDPLSVRDGTEIPGGRPARLCRPRPFTGQALCAGNGRRFHLLSSEIGTEPPLLRVSTATASDVRGSTAARRLSPLCSRPSRCRRSRAPCTGDKAPARAAPCACVGEHEEVPLRLGWTVSGDLCGEFELRTQKASGDGTGRWRLSPRRARCRRACPCERACRARQTHRLRLAPRASASCSRGCTWRCAAVSAWWRRSRRPASAVAASGSASPFSGLRRRRIARLCVQPSLQVRALPPYAVGGWNLRSGVKLGIDHLYERQSAVRLNPCLARRLSACMLTARSDARSRSVLRARADRCAARGGMQRFSRVSNQVGKAIVLRSAVGGEYANTAVEFVTISPWFAKVTNA